MDYASKIFVTPSELLMIFYIYRIFNLGIIIVTNMDIDSLNTFTGDHRSVSLDQCLPLYWSFYTSDKNWSQNECTVTTCSNDFIYAFEWTGKKLPLIMSSRRWNKKILLQTFGNSIRKKTNSFQYKKWVSTFCVQVLFVQPKVIRWNH